MENQSFDFSTTTELSDVDDPEPPSPDIEALSHDAMRINEMYTQSFEAQRAGEMDKYAQLHEEIYEKQLRILAHQACIQHNIQHIDPVDADVLLDELWQSKQLIKKHR
ncbi:hypothetical protein A2707_01080 [Candidatus Saccharibacteria bacterium RIFCSPHIGHO2_01_FULL_45_15]|nr:MAG: hypothetical protein A2707_01080 [Candidatus Saccharibacteria bacterium RIFCSPHIGHO2_01_FULL_45_15]OGL26965.1 MAG: hypothetical protein A3C39_02195 [Candidatus Saccharibacteria bacterium RIFCSPHIGHO2_02_FULL_46_12]OGL32933.1 MAG: hypothetical protein A3E76_06250 [Candidatus Saccharibacteria bacterium RIFCSPHIGHO2_12_FULL_44_22]